MKLPSLQDISVATRQVATKSAVNPLLWISGITTPSSIAAACIVGMPWGLVFLAFGVIPVLYTIRAYEFLLHRDRDRLQSERFLIERQIISKMGNESSDEYITIRSNENVDNPLLGHGDGE